MKTIADISNMDAAEVRFTAAELIHQRDWLLKANKDLRLALTVALRAWTDIHSDYVPEFDIEDDSDYQDVMALRKRALAHGAE